MPLPLMIHSALALFAQRMRIPTSARSIGFCVIWVCISSSSSSLLKFPFPERVVISDTYLLIILLIWLLKPIYLSNTYFYEHYTC